MSLSKGEERISTQAEHESVERLLDTVLRSLDDNKAEDVVSISLAGKTSFADYMVIANGRSQRQVASIADNLMKTVKQEGYPPCKVEGLPQADWVLIDCADVVVHLFRPEVRDYYNLEKMWSVDLPEERDEDDLAVI